MCGRYALYDISKLDFSIRDGILTLFWFTPDGESVSQEARS